MFRTLGSQVRLADRVRDNLVMDSGIAVVCGRELGVRVTMRAQASDYPAESEPQLLERARRLMSVVEAVGYAEIETAVVPLQDPSEPSRQLDVSYEVTFEKGTISREILPSELRYLLSFPRLA